MPIYSFEGRVPKISPEAFIHPTAVIIGRVSIAEDCYIGPGAVLRGDWGEIIVEKGSNVQDNAVIHVKPEATCYLGHESHIGHAAILHGCRLEGHVLVGMGAVINDAAVLEEGCIVASGAVVLGGVLVKSRTMVAGIPAAVRGEVDENRDALMWAGHKMYQTLPLRYQESQEEVSLEEAHRRYREPDPE
jgi:phenylacetic acid degradation protein